MKTVDCKPRRYFTPTSLLAAQTSKITVRSRKLTVFSKPKMYAGLFSELANDVVIGNIPKQTGANRATALRSFMRAHSLHEEDVIGNEMRAHYALAMEKLVELLRQEGRSDRGISNTRAAITPFKLAVVADDTARAVYRGEHTPFVVMLRSLFAGLSIKRVSAQAGIPYAMALGWTNGKVPRARNAHHIRRLEAFFALDRDSLVTVAGISHGPRPHVVVGDAEKVEYRETLGARSRARYYLVPYDDSPLRDQWYEFAKFKTSLTAHTEDLKRTKQGRWTVSANPVTKKTLLNWYLFLDGDEIPTAKSAWSQLAAYLGWLALPIDDGGAGLPTKELQTLAWLTVTDFIEPYIEWQRDRAGGQLSRSVTVFLGLVSSLCRPRLGYLAQKPEFMHTLPESYCGKSWNEMCLAQFEYAEALQDALSHEIGATRDPFEPIRHILDLPKPLDALVDMLQRMRNDRPRGTASTEAIWARDLAMVKLFVSNPVRLRNMATLTWSPDYVDSRHPSNRPCLYKKSDGTWWMFVPKGQMKNRKRKDMKSYDAPVHSSVWNDLERYLYKHRDALIKWPTDLVFLARVSDCKTRELQTCHRPYMEMSKQLFSLTKRYLWKCDGISAHSFRHIVATSIIKANGGDIKTAALVLSDTETTVAQHYSGIWSGDGAKRMGELLGESLNRM